jgi:hypothetical protein
MTVMATRISEWDLFKKFSRSVRQDTNNQTIILWIMTRPPNLCRGRIPRIMIDLRTRQLGKQPDIDRMLAMR